MFGGNRGRHSKTGIIASILFSLLVSIFTIGWGLSVSAEYERQANNQAAEYAAYTNEKVGYSCVGKPSTQKSDCIQEARHARRAYERDEQDLVAQKQSALWAYVMAAAAVIGMGLSVIGVYLVYATFSATREANVIARNAMEESRRDAETARRALIKSERAIISADSAVATRNSQGHLLISLCVANIGKSNATDFVVMHSISGAPEFRGGVRRNTHRSRGICVPLSGIELDGFKLRPPKFHPFFIIGYVAYETLHEGNFKTFFCFEMRGELTRSTMGEIENSVLVARHCKNLPPNS